MHTHRTQETRTILVVAPYFPPDTGGLERYAYEVSRRLAINRAAWHVVVLTTTPGRSDVREERDGMTIHRIAYHVRWSRTPIGFDWFIKVRRLLREVAPTIVHVHTPVPGLGDLVALLLPKQVPLVVTYHTGSMRKGMWYTDPAIWLYERVALPVLLHRAQRIVCVSAFVERYLAQYREKCTVIPPAVDAMFLNGNTEPSAQPNLLFVANLDVAVQHKGLATLIAALPHVLAHVPKTRLTVVGDGDMRAAYEAQVAELGCSPAVTFAGNLAGEDLVRAYQTATVLVHPTENESFGMVIAEAMAAGLPVVSTCVGGVPDLVQDGVTGRLVAPRDPIALAQAILHYLSDATATRTAGQAGRDIVRTEYRWEQRVAAYRAVFERVTNPLPTIVHVSAYAPPHVGGMEKVVDRLAREGARRGYPVRVLTSTQGAGKLARVAREEGLRIERLRSFEVAHTPIIWALLPRLLMLPQNSVIHVHVAQVLTPEIALLAATMRSMRIVAHFHLDVEPSGPLGWLFVWYKKHLLGPVLRHMDAVVAGSEAQADFVVRTYGVARDRMHVVPTAVDSVFCTDRTDHVPAVPAQLLTVSRLTVQKRVDRIIDALSHMHVPAQLTVVGDGEDRVALEARAASVCPGRVHFVGAESHAEIAARMRDADAFVFASEREGGMPLAVLEALAVGLPVVACDTAGVRELVGGRGLLAEPTPASLADALDTCLTDPEVRERAALRGREFARTCTWERAFDYAVAVYSASCAARTTCAI